MGVGKMGVGEMGVGEVAPNHQTVPVTTAHITFNNSTQ